MSTITLRYYAIQIDDEGARRIIEECTTPRAVALYVAGLADWVGVEEFAVTWCANSPTGGERFEIGVDGM